MFDKLFMRTLSGGGRGPACEDQIVHYNMNALGSNKHMSEPISLMIRAYKGYTCITESVDSVCRDTTYTQYMPIQKNLAKSQKRYTYKPL